MPVLKADRSLLEGFRRGLPDAISTVYWAYVGKVERLLSDGFETRSQGVRVRGVGQQRHELADLVQETFVRAFSEKGRSSYDGLRDYGPFLFAIARNVLVDWARQQGRETALPSTEIEMVAGAVQSVVTPEPWTVPATLRVVEEYLGGLPQDLREVHRLRYEEGLSQNDAAEQMKVGRQTLRTLEGRLRKGLAASLAAAKL